MRVSDIVPVASSALPYRRAPPTWLKTTPEDVVEHIIKLARKGLTPSQIGVTLRDSHGIPQVRFVTGNKILRILKSQGASSFLSLHSYSYTLDILFLYNILFILVPSWSSITHLLFGDRTWPIHPWGPLAPHQKGGCRPQAPRNQPQRQRLEVPFDLNRIPYSSSCALLQDKATDPADLQVWFGDCVDAHCLSGERGMGKWWVRTPFFVHRLSILDMVQMRN